jgi:hypothetical protein
VGVVGWFASRRGRVEHVPRTSGVNVKQTPFTYLSCDAVDYRSD